MITIPFLIRLHQTTRCTIEVEHSEASLHAHLDLDGRIELRPGDRVRVHGAPISLAFGERLVLRREATIERAGWVERQWVRLTARLNLGELYEVSFSPGRLT